MSFMTTNKILLLLYGKYIIDIMTTLFLICFSAAATSTASAASAALTNNI